MVEKKPPLQLFEIPEEICQLIAQAGGIEATMTALAKRRTARTKQTWSEHHEGQDIDQMERTVWQWLFGQYDGKMGARAKREVVRRTLFITAELQKVFAKCEGLATGTFTDEFVAELTQVIFNLAPAFTGWRFTKALDDNSIAYADQWWVHMRNTVTHVLSMLVYADEMVPIFNAGLRAQHSNDHSSPPPQIDKNRFKVFALLHDLGRWITQEQVVHERVERFIFMALGIPENVLQFEFEAMARLSSPDPSMRDVALIPLEKRFAVGVDISAKMDTEASQEQLRGVDVDYVTHTPGLRAIHYFAHCLVREQTQPEFDAEESYEERVRRKQQELEAAFMLVPVSETRGWLEEFFREVSTAGSPVNQSLVTKYLNETEFYQHLIPDIAAICVAGGKSFTQIREAVNERVIQQMNDGTFYPLQGGELSVEDRHTQPVEIFTQLALLESILQAVKQQTSYVA